MEETQECTHPEDKKNLDLEGYMWLAAGEVQDNLQEVVVCLECGCYLLPVQEDPEEDIIF